MSRSQAFYRGPLPPADELEKYEQILTGMADRVVTMAETNGSHRQSLERAVVEGNLRAQERSQVFAFVLALVIIGVGAWLVSMDKAVIGMWLILGDVAGLAAAFITGKVIQRKERLERRKTLGDKIQHGPG